MHHTTTPLLAVSGWAQPPDALRPLAPDAAFLDYRTCRAPQCPVQLLARHHPHITTAIGWSLGGWLLMRAIEQKKITVQQLVLIASPLQYVSTPEFTHGMDPVTFDLFVKSYASDPVRTSKRFSALIAKGDTKFSEVLEQLEYWEESAEKDTWAFWLDVLGAQQATDFTFDGFPPTLIVQGGQDKVIARAQGEALAECIPGATLQLLEESGHAPHLHDAMIIRDAIARHAAQHGVAHAA